MGLKKTLFAFSCMSVTLACAVPAHATTFQTGQFVTGAQGDWGSGGLEASLLSASYDSAYAATSGLLSVGINGVSGEYSLEFTDSSYILAYLPADGTVGPLLTSLLDPTIAAAGVFGGNVVALDLNIAFSTAGLLGTSRTPFGDLVLTNFGGVRGSTNSLDGLTVSEFLMNVADPCLAGGACPYGIDNVASVTDDLNYAFEPGVSLTWADQHLALPATPTPEPGTYGLMLIGVGLLGLATVVRKRDSRSHQLAS